MMEYINSMNIFLIVGVIAIFVIIYFYLQKEVKEDEKDEKINDILENKMFGETIDKGTFLVLNTIISKTKKDANDYYNLGNIYLCHLNDFKNGYENYFNAIQSVMQGNVKIDEAVPILYRIESIINKSNSQVNCNIVMYRINNNLLSLIRHAHYQIHLNRLHTSAIERKNRITKEQQPVSNEQQSTKSIQPVKSEKKPQSEHGTIQQIQKNVKWKTDTQNVHDSKILDTMKLHYEYIKYSNDIENVPHYTFDNVQTALLQKCKNNCAITNVLNRIKSNSMILNIKNTGEADLLIEVYRRINSPKNNNNKSDLLNALITSLDDCTEKGRMVCPSGRQTRIIASLAILDADSKSKHIGILKNKEAIRNEIFETAAKIVDRELKKSPKNVIEAYNKNLQTSEVRELETRIKNDISRLKKTYRDKMSDYKIENIVDECLAVI